MLSRTYANKGVCSGQLCQHQLGRHARYVLGAIEIGIETKAGAYTFLQIEIEKETVKPGQSSFENQVKHDTDSDDHQNLEILDVRV